MVASATPTATERFAHWKSLPDCVPYAVDIPVGGKRPYRFSIYVVVSTAEIFVEVTKDCHTQVQSFVSRQKDCSSEDRREGMDPIDASEAYALAKEMSRPRPRSTKQLTL